ncbi:MAG: protein kinase [Acidobacteriota bacterium]
MPATNELLQEGRYRINHQIPLDGKSNVYEAYDTVRDANVVVKEINVQLNRVATAARQESIKVEFASQAKTLTEIEHESLLHVHDYFTETGRQYLVMESVDGDDLAELLERNKSAFAVSDVTEWADQILDALNHLHTFKPPIFHRNVRPQNVKLSSAGKIKLLAFGLAESDEARPNTSLKEGSSDPAINYSPLELIWDGLDAASQKVIANSYDDRSERLLKEPADARSDIYSLGATLYHLVTGRTPVDPLERSIEMLDGNADPLQPPHEVDSKIPIELSEVLMRSLEIKRENRFDSAVIMRQVVRTAMVRAHERETEFTQSEEARELAEAAEDIRLAGQMRQNQKAAPPAADAEQKRRQEALAQQLREAEAAKAAAEKLEAEKVLREKEAAEAAERANAEAVKREALERAQAEADAVMKELKQDLLEIDAESAEVQAVEPQVVEAAEDRPRGKSKKQKSANVETAEVVAYDASATAGDEIELGGMFSDKSAETKGGMGMAMIAGIAGVVLVIVVAGWVLLSSGSSTPEVRPTQAPPVVQIPPTEPAQSTSTTASTIAESAPQPSSEVQQAPETAPSRAAAQPAAVKTKTEKEAPKPAEKKKAVTVDDLINDN